jgi:hypothetical protein
LAGLTLGAGIGGLGAVGGTVEGTKAAALAGAGANTATPALNASIAAMNAPGAASSVSPFITQGLSAIGSKGALAPGAGVLAPAFGGGLTNAQVAAAGFGPEAGGIYSAGSSPINAGKMDKAMEVMAQGQSMAGGQPSQPRPKATSFPEIRMASSQGANPLPGEELRKRRMASGIRTPGMSRIGGSRNV